MTPEAQATLTELVTLYEDEEILYQELLRLSTTQVALYQSGKVRESGELYPAKQEILLKLQQLERTKPGGDDVWWSYTFTEEERAPLDLVLDRLLPLIEDLMEQETIVDSLILELSAREGLSPSLPSLNSQEVATP